MNKVEMQISEVFAPLVTENHRIKFYYGGRGGGKSYAFADCLLLIAQSRKVRVVCLREIQDSIRDSVHKLLCDRISFYDFKDYIITDKTITHRRTKSEFIFKGLRDQDPQKIKSLEGIDIAWIEEGQTITKKSWEILEPTIRKEGSEIWISMNRKEETDPLWVAVAANPDDRTYVCKVNYYDNPFCTEELKLQAEKCKNTDYESYLHIWEGEPEQQGNEKLISAMAVKKAIETVIDNSNINNPLIIGVDPARMGDDATAICFRRGRQAYKIRAYHKKNVVEVANTITAMINDYRPVRVNIDVGGLGAGLYDILDDRGYTDVVRAVNFGEKAQDQERYANRRAEMWNRVNEWLNGELPVSVVDEDNLLLTDLTAPKKKYDKIGRLLLEPKEDIKKRIGRSTDVGDALALTFAELDYPRTLEEYNEVLFVDDNFYIC